jgi:hypothetical protein
MNNQRIISHIISIDAVLTGPFMGVVRSGPWFKPANKGEIRR